MKSKILVSLLYLRKHNIILNTNGDDDMSGISSEVVTFISGFDRPPRFIHAKTHTKLSFHMHITNFVTVAIIAVVMQLRLPWQPISQP
jgi:hypothetical protein